MNENENENRNPKWLYGIFFFFYSPFIWYVCTFISLNSMNQSLLLFVFRRPFFFPLSIIWLRSRSFNFLEHTEERMKLTLMI